MEEGKRPAGHVTLQSTSEVASLLNEAASFAREAVPENTRRAYRADWQDFVAWCERRKLSALPARPRTVTLYLTARARTHRVSTLSRRLTVIGKVHKLAHHENPAASAEVRKVWRGIVRTKGEAVTRKKPAVTQILRKMIATLENSLSGQRNRAIILFGFAGAMRRSELVSLNWGDLELTDDAGSHALCSRRTRKASRPDWIGTSARSKPCSSIVRARKRAMSDCSMSSVTDERTVPSAARTCAFCAQCHVLAASKSILSAAARSAETFGDGPTSLIRQRVIRRPIQFQLTSPLMHRHRRISWRPRWRLGTRLIRRATQVGVPRSGDGKSPDCSP